MANESDFYSFMSPVDDGKNILLVAISTDGKNLFCLDHVNQEREFIISIDKL